MYGGGGVHRVHNNDIVRNRCRLVSVVIAHASGVRNRVKTPRNGRRPNAFMWTRACNSEAGSGVRQRPYKGYGSTLVTRSVRSSDASLCVVRSRYRQRTRFIDVVNAVHHVEPTEQTVMRRGRWRPNGLQWGFASLRGCKIARKRRETIDGRTFSRGRATEWIYLRRDRAVRTNGKRFDRATGAGVRQRPYKGYGSTLVTRSVRSSDASLCVV